MSISHTLKLRGSLALISSLIITSSAIAGSIDGSAHDFVGTEYDSGGHSNQICIFCHTPHNANTSVSIAPLWNRDVLVTKTYILYGTDSPTLDADIRNPDGISLLCLSCHDGSVAVDAYGDNDGTVFITDEDLLIGGGNDLSDDHPVSFTYNDALAGEDGALHTPSDTEADIGTTDDKFKQGTIAENLLFNYSLECASCHDVHNTFTSDYVYPDGRTYLLKISMENSELCLTCHDK